MFASPGYFNISPCQKRANLRGNVLVVAYSQRSRANSADPSDTPSHVMDFSDGNVRGLSYIVVSELTKLGETDLGYL